MRAKYVHQRGPLLACSTVNLSRSSTNLTTSHQQHPLFCPALHCNAPLRIAPLRTAPHNVPPARLWSDTRRTDEAVAPQHRFSLPVVARLQPSICKEKGKGKGIRKNKRQRRGEKTLPTNLSTLLDSASACPESQICERHGDVTHPTWQRPLPPCIGARLIITLPAPIW